MYRLIRVYDDGHIAIGKHVFMERDIEALACLIIQLKTVTYEFAIAYCIEEEECITMTESIPVRKKDAIVQTQ